MHNNFYFLRQLSRVLDSRLTGSILSECYSQQKDELIIRLETTDGSAYIRCHLLPALASLSFPEVFHRARKNSVDLFTSLGGLRVTGVRQFNHERSFGLTLSESFFLLFKMHGHNANVILFQDGKPIELFRNNFTQDLHLDPERLDRSIDFSKDTFISNLHRLPDHYFTWGKVVWQYLEERGFAQQRVDEKWITLQETVAQLENPGYFVTENKGRIILSLLPVGQVRRKHQNPVAALNDFFQTHQQESGFLLEQNELIRHLTTRIHQSEAFRAKNKKKLEELENDNHFRVWADLIMANLHAISPNTDKVILPDFYEENKLREVPLKQTMSPQKNAELYYKKARNQHIEAEMLRKSLHEKEKAIEQFRLLLRQAGETHDVKTLRKLREEITGGGEAREASRALPFHEFVVKGFRIWVGKNAQSNDTLTQRHAYKEDLWLHAKDVAGSHVLIKHQAGKTFPRDVIERAAQLAAYYSKRKTESLCPVIVTPRKFVRKRKGDPPGAVVVEREEVVMVVPSP